MGKPKNFETSQYHTISQWRGTIDEIVTCPYDSSHVMKYTRIHIHIKRCAENLRRSNPTVFKSFVVCDYNSLHRVPKEKMEEHLKDCKDHIWFVSNRAKSGKSSCITKKQTDENSFDWSNESFDPDYVSEWL